MYLDPWRSISGLLSYQAQQSPSAIAIQAPGRPDLTYDQLGQTVSRIRATLREQGLAPTDRVAVVLPNGPEMAVAFLAIAAGFCCAPLNPQYQRPEFAFYLEDVGAKAVMVPQGSDSPVRGAAQTLGIPVIDLAVLPEEPAGLFTFPGLPWADLVGEGNPEETTALILHTSGTTSRPKIVPLTHCNLLTSARHIAQTLHLTPADGCFNLMPLFHIHGLVGCLLSSLAAGGRVICTGGLDPSRFFADLDTYRPTWYSAVPTLHQQILVQAHRESRGLVPSLRFIRSSSAALPTPVLADLEAQFQVPVIEAYGMTEAAHQMASNPLPPLPRKPKSVGRSAGPEVAIMDSDGQFLSAFTPGEVVIRGENVTLGYENNPTANGQAFTQGWFRTGDQGYLDDEGYLFLQGRLKEQINRGGEKIMPLEVDEALLALPGVHQAVTFAMAHPTLGEDVGAAVVLKPGVTKTSLEIREALMEQLAEFKIPRQVIFVEDIPKGPTGKLQRIGLAEKLAPYLQPPYVPPRNATEQAIADIVAQVLGIDSPGIEDNFFALGGDSLTGTQVMARLARHFGIDLNPALIFRHSTVATLAIAVDELLATLAEDEGDLISALQNLSPEEVAQLLGEVETS